MVEGESSGGGGTDTRTNVSLNGSEVVSSVSDINFSNGSTILQSVTDDGDGTVTVGSVVDEGFAYTWTNNHMFQQPSPSSGRNTWVELEDTSNSAFWRWTLDSSANLVLETESGGVTELPIQISAPALEVMVTGLRSTTGMVTETDLDYGSGADIRTTFQSADDAFVIRDNNNSLDRVQIDRTTGNHTIEGTYTEGAAL